MKRILPPSFFAAAAAAILLSLPPGVARADDKAACIAGFESGQKLRREGKLTAALTELALCARDVCPRSLQKACVEQATESAALLPSIVLSASDGAHNDVTDVKVSVDGVGIATVLDGKAVSIDPGPHAFRFERAGLAPVERQVVVKEGQKGQPVAAQFALAEASPSPSVSHDKPTRRWLGVGAGALGVIGIAVGSAFGVLAFNKWSDAKSLCSGGMSGACGAGTAAYDAKSTGQTDATVSTVGFIAGGVLAAGGVALFFTSGHASTGTSAALTPTLGGMQLVGRF